MERGVPSVRGVDGDFAAIADHDHAAVGGEKFRVVGEIHIGEHFENDVHAAAGQWLFIISSSAPGLL